MGAVSLCITLNYESHTLIVREFAVSDLHFATVYGLRTDLGGFLGGGCLQTPCKLLHFVRKFVQT